jgi:hypothetical protein
MKRCQWRGLNVHTPNTRDSIQVTDAAAESVGVALLRKGCNVTCRCMAEEGVDPSDCDSLIVTDPNGSHIVTIHGAEFKARELGNGNIAIYKTPSQTGDSATTEYMGKRLADITRANAKFWEPREE